MTFALEIGAHGGKQQALAEAPWPREEIVLSFRNKLMDKSRLVDIDVAVGADVLKILYPDGIFHIFV